MPTQCFTFIGSESRLALEQEWAEMQRAFQDVIQVAGAPRETEDKQKMLDDYADEWFDRVDRHCVREDDSDN